MIEAKFGTTPGLPKAMMMKRIGGFVDFLND